MSEIGKKLVFKPVEKTKTDLDQIREEIVGQEIIQQEKERQKPRSILAEIRERLKNRKRIKITDQHREMGIDGKIQEAAVKAEAEYRFEKLIKRAFGSDYDDPGYPV